MRTAAILATAAVLSCCSNAVEPVDPGSLVITGVDGEVTLVDPASGEREVLAEPSLYQGPVQPTASRDGEVVVWTAVRADGQPVVAIHDVDGIREIEAPTFPYFYSFGPDSTTVAALGDDPDRPAVALMLVDLSADGAQIIDVGRPYYLDWHPDQLALAVHVDTDLLAVLDVGGGRQEIPVELGDFQAPAWTGDGRLLAPVRSEGATAAVGPTIQATIDELAVVDTTDGSHETVAQIDEMVMFEVSGERVAFVEGSTGLGPITVVGLDGGGKTEVSSEDVVAFEWSPSGDLLLFHSLEDDRGLVPHVWDGTEVVAYPAFVPTRVFLLEYLPFWSQYVRTITQWAPDGTAFAYADGTGDTTIWVQPLEEERSEMGTGVMVTWSP